MKTPKDWDIIAQKKDIEEIKFILRRNLFIKQDRQKKVVISLIITMIATVITTLITNYISIILNGKGKIIPFWFYPIIVLILVILATIPFYKDIFKLFTKKRYVSQKNIEEIVDRFDNDTIYNAMVASKYYEMYEFSRKSNNNDYETNFYYIETIYMIKKVLHQLTLIEKEATCEKDNMCGYGQNKRITIARIEFVFDFVCSIEKKINNSDFSSEIFEEKTIIEKIFKK